jgi:mannan endo-1,4-beta-mannosidase
MKRILLLPIIIFTFFLILPGCSSFLLSEKPNYVGVNGTQFEFDGKPYYFTGTNLWYGCYIGSSGKTGDRQRLIRELDKLKLLGITNLRILGASEESYIKNSLKPAIQIKPGVYDENLLDGLDFLLSEMHKRNMHAVIFLNNYWEWTGGMAQYNDWANGGGGVDPGSSNYGNFMDYSASFYGYEKANELFLDFVYHLITRKNHYDGVYYYEDPTIMAWQLANEPRPGRNRYWVDEYYTWLETTAQFIHNIDPNHLVTTGNEGLAGSLGDSTIYLNAHKIKYIDYMTIHLWPKNWGWFDANNIEKTYPRTEKNAIEYIQQHIKFARELNKPLVMEEFGMPRDSEKCAAGTPTTARDKYFKKILWLVYDSASSGAPIAGTNFWGWGGEGRSQHPDNRWQPGDPFTGDPPPEPQGLNSVFNTDTSTIAILKNNAELMNSLDNKPLIRKQQNIIVK